MPHAIYFSLNFLCQFSAFKPFIFFLFAIRLTELRVTSSVPCICAYRYSALNGGTKCAFRLWEQKSTWKKIGVIYSRLRQHLYCWARKMWLFFMLNALADMMRKILARILKATTKLYILQKIFEFVTISGNCSNCRIRWISFVDEQTQMKMTKIIKTQAWMERATINKKIALQWKIDCRAFDSFAINERILSHHMPTKYAAVQTMQMRNYEI